MLAVIPTLLRSAYTRQRDHGNLCSTIRSTLFGRRRRGNYTPLMNNDTEIIIEPQDSDTPALIGNKTNSKPPFSDNHISHDAQEKGKHLGIIPTARLSFAFCFLWFGANYFAMACLQYTTVASTTILTSTSSFWTLFIGALTGTERFTWRKLCGVLGSFVGIILVSRVDLGSRHDDAAPTPPDGGSHNAARFLLDKRLDTFPDKSPSELALGDALALFSAIIYGVYTITLKKSTLKALPRSLNMALFFGLVGTFNLILLFPLFPILHFLGLEHFKLPPTRRIWTILLINSVSSFASDICWAYAMVLTSPLLVTVGLSLTIPLSLVGEMVLQGRYEGWVYWVGAGIVVGSFLFIDQEERGEEGHEEMDGQSGREGVDATEALFSDEIDEGESEHPSAANRDREREAESLRTRPPLASASASTPAPVPEQVSQDIRSWGP